MQALRLSAVLPSDQPPRRGFPMPGHLQEPLIGEPCGCTGIVNNKKVLMLDRAYCVTEHRDASSVSPWLCVSLQEDSSRSRIVELVSSAGRSRWCLGLSVLGS